MPAAATQSLPTRSIYGVEILRVGRGNGRVYTKDDITGAYDAYLKLREYGYKPTAKLGHNPAQPLLVQDGLPNAGIAEEMYVSEDGEALLADVIGVPDRIGQLIEAGSYNTRSSELWLDQELIPDQPALPIAVKGWAWLGQDAPALKNLNEIEALYHGELAAVEAIIAGLPLPHEPSVYNDERGAVTVIDNVPADAENIGQSDEGGAEQDGSMSSNRTPATNEDMDGHGPRVGIHTHAHPAYGVTTVQKTGMVAGRHSHEHEHHGDANHNHPHPASLDGNPEAADAAQTPDMITNADASDADKAKAAQESRSKRYSIGIKKDTNVSKPSEWKNVPDSQWGDPVNYSYPMPDKDHADNAASRFGDADNTSDYSAEEKKIVSGRITRRQKALGTKAADATNAESDLTDYEVRSAVQDALEACYPQRYDVYGWALPMPGNEGPCPCIIDINRDQHWVVVCGEDGDNKWQIPFTIDANTYEAELGDPVRVRISYEAIPSEMMADRSQTQEGESVTDDEYRSFWKLPAGADVKQHMISQRANSVSLADHNAVVARLTALESNTNLKDATVRVDAMKARGQIGGSQEQVEAMTKFAVDICLSDPERFAVWEAQQPIVVDYSVQGLSEDGVDPTAARGAAATTAHGPQAAKDLAVANKALRVTPEEIAERGTTSFDQRREQMSDERANNPALNWRSRPLGMVLRG